MLEVHPTGQNQKKSDVLVLFSGNFILGVNIKAGKSNFNQVTRMWLDRFATEIGLSEKSKDMIQEGIDNHRLKRSNVFIKEDYQEIIKTEFQIKIKLIMELIFRGINNDIVKILTLYDRNKRIFYLYDMQEVIDFLSTSDITFSDRGIIRIGKYLTMQRKGGNGVKHTIPKSDPRHPGNQIQFKMKIISFMNDVEPFLRLK